MGKHQRASRIRSARLAVVASPTKGKPQSAEPTADRKKEVLPIVEKLQAEDVSERIWAAASLSGIIATGDASLRLLLLAQNLVGRLIELLSFDNTELKLEVTGVLRNLAVEGGGDVCAEMYNKHIIAALARHLEILAQTLTRIQQPTDTMTDASADEPKEIRQAWDWAENVVTIFWSIAELAPKSLSALADLPALVPFLLSILKAIEAASHTKSPSKSTPPLSLGIAAAHCLAVLADSNRALSLRLLAYPAHTELEPLIPLLRPELHTQTPADVSLLGVLCASALLNIYSTVLVDRREPGSSESFAPKAIRSRALEIKEDVDRLAPRLLARVIDALDLQGIAGSANSVLQAQSGKPASLGQENAVAALNDRLTAGQVALEVLGEISASIDGLVVDPDQEEEEWTGFGDGMEEDDASPPEIEMANGHPQPLLSLSSDTLTLLSALPARLIILAKPTTAGFAPSSEAQNVDTLPTDAQPSSSHLAVPPSTAALLPLVHLRALECLNNLFVTLARAIKPPPPAKGDDDEDDEMEEEVIAAAPEEARLPEGFAASAQSVWEGLFGIVLELQGTVLPQASVSTGKKAKVLPPLGSEELVHAVEAGLGAIWALARAHIDGLTIGQSETPFLLSVIASTAPPISNESKQRAIGALGVLAARAGVSHKENKLIGDALLSLATTMTTPMLLATQALDSLFDIYADETSDYDVPVFRASGYLPTLEALQVAWRTRTKQVDRRKDGELRSMADEVAVNLKAFVAYRKSLRL